MNIEIQNEQNIKVRQLVALLQADSIKSITEFGTKVIEFIAQQTQAYQGVLYICQQEDEKINAIGTYATTIKKNFEYGEGLIGQVVLSKKFIHLNSTSNNTNSTKGIIHFKPNHAIIFPLIFNQKVYGVIELLFLQPLTTQQQSFLERIAGYIGASLYNLIVNEKTENLLQALQGQNKELQYATQRQEVNMRILKKVREKMIEQQKRLQEEHLKTTQSIRYAKKIQNAFLPTKQVLNTIFPNSFLLYSPKDIISGDFYWCSQHDTKRIVIVADCTGHGVPGAFMSIVGSNLISEILYQEKTMCPAMILTKVHQGIRKKLNQDDSQNDDGMDMTVCLIESNDDQSHQLTFAGAKHFMVVIDQQNQLKILKGDRKSVGGKNISDNRQFTNQHMTINPQEMMYLFSDGFIDQPNTQRRSIGRVRLQNLLASVSHLPAKEQKEKIQNFLEKYKENTPQRDDITLLGIQL